MSISYLQNSNFQSYSLLTDFYQITMAYGYWKAGMDQQEAVFHLFFRKNPFKGGFTISAGLESAIRFLENFHFDQNDIDYLASLTTSQGQPLFEIGFFEYLKNLKFSCDLDAVPEGNVVFPHEPLIRVQGPLVQCQLLESPLLNLINFPSLIATKAARICLAAEGDPVFEFGLRRAQGIDGALTASRASYIGGCEGTSNVLAGKIFGIPVRGTHSHSWVMAFDDEIDSFETFARHLPEKSVFLVDTYNTLDAVSKAIKVAQQLEKTGKKFGGIRLDSGDLAYLSIKSRTMLDDAGFKHAKIVASNELDETIISELKKQGAKIDIWGVGTNLVTAANQPALDGVYKLSAIRGANHKWKYKLKLSEQIAKITNPGILQVRRFVDEQENIADAIYDIHRTPIGDFSILDPFDSTRQKILKGNLLTKDLLVPIFRKGTRIYEFPLLEEIRNKTIKELAQFHSGIKRFLNPHQYVVGLEQSLYNLKVQLIKDIRSRIAHYYTENNE